jgi:hypothetical protein
MSKTKKKAPARATKPARNSKLPAALARRASAAASAKTARALATAREHLAVIARRKNAITEAFYDIGVALTALKKPEMVAALGRRSFAEVCEKDAGLSAVVAERLIAIVRNMTAEQALAMGQKKAMAMIDLAAATPDHDDTAAGLFRKKSIALPGGRTLDTRAASANAIEEAAKAIRHRVLATSARRGGPTKPARGRTTSADERSLAELLQRKLHKLGLERARVTAVATKAGHESDLRFEHIPVSQLDALKQAIGR